jgi:hypothetical protein
MSRIAESAWGDTPLGTYIPPARAFDGATYDPARDHARLKGQLLKVYQLMSDGQWRTLRQIADAVGVSEASVSARCRDLRKSRYGSHAVERQHVGCGLFRYRMTTST